MHWLYFLPHIPVPGAVGNPTMNVTWILPSKNSECGKRFVLFIDMYSIKTRKLTFVQSKKIIVHTVACVCVCGAIQFFFFSFYVCSQARGRIRAAFATYVTACVHARSLTHWVRPGIKPMSSWRLCWVLNLVSHNGNSRSGLFVYLQVISSKYLCEYFLNKTKEEVTFCGFSLVMREPSVKLEELYHPRLKETSLVCLYRLVTGTLAHFEVLWTSVHAWLGSERQR